jgi:diaminopimelate decarboxylase
VNFLGIHSHIGSQIFDLEPFEDLAKIMVQHITSLKDQTGLAVTELNLGGGIGIQYTTQDDPPAIAAYLEKMTACLKAECQASGLPLPRLIVEPGRSIVGPAGLTLYTIGSIKSIPGIKDYIFVDGGMADNPRPMMYQAQYTFQIVNRPTAPLTHVYTIAGKYCESGDILAKDVRLPEAHPGDILAVYGTGAYNYSMASHYNRSAKPAMVLVESGQSRLLVRRETFDDLMQYDLP